MRRLLLLASLIIAASVSGMAQGLSPFNGDCALGGQASLTQGLKSVGTIPIAGGSTSTGSGVLASYPRCSVTVFFTGTVNKPSLFSNNLSTPTPLTNPFNANTDGTFLFFVSPACYDIILNTGSGPTMPTTRTYTSVCLGSSNNPPVSPVTFSATPTFAATPFGTFSMTLTGNVTSSTVTNPINGETISFILCQDGTGGRTFAWPASFLRPPTIVATASTCSNSEFVYDGTNWRQIALGDAVAVTSSGNNNLTGSNTVCVLNGAQEIDSTNSCNRPGPDWVGWFNSAVTAAGPGGRIHFKAGVYAAASTSPSFSVPLIITGDGAGIALGARPTVLTLAPGVSGFKCLGAAQFSRISDIYVLSQSTLFGSDSGVLAQCHAFQLSDVIFDGFGNRGVDTSAVTANGQNTNNWLYENVRAINNKGDGFYLSGDNANLGTCINCDASNNTGWGFNETGLAGNTFINPHVNANGAGGYREDSASNRWFNAYCEGAATFTLTANTNNNHIESIVFAPCTITDLGVFNEIKYVQSTYYGTDYFNILPKPGVTTPTVYSFSSGSYSNGWFAMADQTNTQNIVAYEPGAKIWHFTTPVSMVADNGGIGGVGVSINAPVGATSPHNYQWVSGSFGNSQLSLADLTASQNIQVYDPTTKMWSWISTLGGLAWNRAGVFDLFISPTAPTIAAAGCGGSAAAMSGVPNGTASFDFNVGTAPTSSCTITFSPAAAHEWNCPAPSDWTSPTTAGGYNIKQTSGTTTTAVFTFYNAAGAATAPTASDIIHVGGCMAN